MKNLVKTIGDPWFWQRSKKEFGELLLRYPYPHGSDILSLTKQYRGQGWYKRLGAYQIDDEFLRLADWARSLEPKVIVEIGTANGATLLAWSRIVSGRVISIDLPGGIHGGGYAEQKSRLFKEFILDRPGIRMDLIREDSQDARTKERVRGLLGSEAIDILYIDGDHRLEGVTRDYELWRDLVRPGGAIVFHDVVPHTRVKNCKVDVLWQSIKERYPRHTTEIVADQSQGWAGIGILTVTSDA